MELLLHEEMKVEEEEKIEERRRNEWGRKDLKKEQGRRHKLEGDEGA